MCGFIFHFVILKKFLVLNFYDIFLNYYVNKILFLIFELRNLFENTGVDGIVHYIDLMKIKLL